MKLINLSVNGAARVGVLDGEDVVDVLAVHEAQPFLAPDDVAALGSTVDAQTQRLISVLWSAAQLALVANRRVVRADAHLSVIGQPPRQAKAAFSGKLKTQPPTLVRDHIRSSLPSPPAEAPAG
jgi:hypothetical protein